MKKIITIAICFFLAGCSAFVPKKTDFYKNGKLVQSFIGRGVWDYNQSFGSYKIWTPRGNSYYQYTCDKCEVVETPLEPKK